MIWNESGETVKLLILQIYNLEFVMQMCESGKNESDK